MHVVPVPPNLDYEMWCGPAPVRSYTAVRLLVFSGLLVPVVAGYMITLYSLLCPL